MSHEPTSPPPGWHQDGDRWRWWDGNQWTEHTSPGTPAIGPRWYNQPAARIMIGLLGLLLLFGSCQAAQDEDQPTYRIGRS